MKITPVPTIPVRCYVLPVTDGIETRSQSGTAIAFLNHASTSGDERPILKRTVVRVQLLTLTNAQNPCTQVTG
jgi:hypothetical protein